MGPAGFVFSCGRATGGAGFPAVAIAYRTGESDHSIPWPDGETSAVNLNGFCTSHHRGKHQAPGWQFDLAPDGTLTVITPTGLVASTTPPPY